MLQFKSKDINASLELVFGKSVAANKNVNLIKLKGHNLAPHTLKKSLPTFILQIYTNPCLYWLHQPAFYVLVQRLGISKEEEVITEIDQLKRIFSSEFITCKENISQDSKRIVEVMNSINIAENDELKNLLLASILPFVFCYFNVVEVIRDQVLNSSYMSNIHFV